MTSQIATIYPTYVLHKVWMVSSSFNDRLYDLAVDDNLANRVTDDHRADAIGGSGNHLGHLRHNFLLVPDPVIAEFTMMVDFGVREFLRSAYGYVHTGEISMMADTFWQRRSHRENVGINAHAHPKADIVVTYYPRIRIDADAPKTGLHRGELRVYDPANIGKKFWPVRSPNHHGGWYGIEPVEGSMIILEGHVPHDSASFCGQERMCVPVLCDVQTPRSHVKVPVTDLMSMQECQ